VVPEPVDAEIARRLQDMMQDHAGTVIGGITDVSRP
jgi:hypothetical protein